MIGGNWGACDPENPKNRRSRPSVLVEARDTTILIDTSPDLRAQLIAAGVRKIDAVLYTHDHADHVHGVDDLRTIYRLMGRRQIPTYADPTTLASIIKRFAYVFEGYGEAEALYRPILVPKTIDGPFAVGPVDVVPFVQDHGICASLGFRIGRFAYSTDVVRLDEAAFDALAGIEVWIVDCLRDGDVHPTHANLATALGWIGRVKPKRAVFTHMNHMADYDALASLCPQGVEPGYDGMVLDVKYP
jgi:phosphoribosyl 1,2-cyclic phosphate phosphodiesterase